MAKILWKPGLLPNPGGEYASLEYSTRQTIDALADVARYVVKKVDSDYLDA